MMDSIKGLLAQALQKLSESHEQVRKIEPYRLLRVNIVSLQALENRVKIAMRLILNKATKSFTDKAANLKDAIVSFLADARQQLQFNREKIARIRPEGILRKKTVELSAINSKANAVIKDVINRLKIHLASQENRLVALNPRSVVQRGYSITTNKKTGLLVRKLDDVQIGDLLITELAEEKRVESKVTKK
jgi:exodeoxyribonuclease VII large subunit